MNAVIIYESLFGNTEQVARSIAEGIARHLPVEVYDVDAVPDGAENTASLLVVGGPTHAFSMTSTHTREDAVKKGATHGSTVTGIREWLAGLRPGERTAALATFDTRVDKVRHLPGSAAKKAAKAAGKVGFARAASPESFYVKDVDGPLLPGELDRALAWGDRLGAEAVGRTADRAR
jgi:flavodoxin